MNLSHAVAIVLYELSRIKPGPWQGEKADREGLLSHYELLLRTIGYPEHKFERAIIMLRRIFARADLSQKEVSMLRGILRKTLWKVRNR
jgi:tRNA C32,U32 (ribose-2'-O)-methylase TrmJ